MSTSFPQDVLRRIRALEQRAGLIETSVSDIVDTDAAATFPLTLDDGTDTYSLVAASGHAYLQVLDDATGQIGGYTYVRDTGSGGLVDLNAFTSTSFCELTLNTGTPAYAEFIMFYSGVTHSVSLFMSSGAPSISANNKGDLCVDDTNGRLFINIDGSTTWAPVGWADAYTSASVSGSVTVDYNVARVHKLTLTGNVTSLTLSNSTSGFACGLTLYLIQDGTGSRTVTWPGSVKWPSGTAPTLSTAASSVDIVVLESTDGGTTWYGNLAGKGYA